MADALSAEAPGSTSLRRVCPGGLPMAEALSAEAMAEALSAEAMAEALLAEFTSLRRLCPGGLPLVLSAWRSPPSRRPLSVLNSLFSLPVPSNITACVSTKRIFFLLLLLVNFFLVCLFSSLSSLLPSICHAGSIFFCARTWCPKFTVHAGTSISQICPHWRFFDASACTPVLSMSQSSFRNSGDLSISLRGACARLHLCEWQTPRI